MDNSNKEVRSISGASSRPMTASATTRPASASSQASRVGSKASSYPTNAKESFEAAKEIYAPKDPKELAKISVYGPTAKPRKTGAASLGSAVAKGVTRNSF